MPFGKIDKADLELKNCEFEPDANAEVLFDKGDVYIDRQFDIVTERHTRIKIFNDNGKKNADIRITYVSANRLEYITELQAQTINLVDGKPEITKIDKKQIFTQVVDKATSATVFSLPNVKPGSVIEYKYKITHNSIYRFPSWYYQKKIPVRYSELTTKIPEWFYYKPQFRTKQMFAKNKTENGSESLGYGTETLSYSYETSTRALANVHSLPDEPYMSSDADNLDCVHFTLTSIRPPQGFVQSGADTWPKIGGLLADDEDFGKQLKRKLAGEEAFITKAKAFAKDDDKIAYLFREVRNAMKWNGDDSWYTYDGTVKAWEKKTGNSSEVNLILFHLLKQSGVKAYPMVVSTRSNGRVNPYTPFLYQFNRAVVYIPVDSTKRYVLDATNKYNLYNEVPDNLLNSTGLYIDKESNTYDLVYLKNNEPVRQSYFINAEIKPDGKMAGSVQISSFSYNKIYCTSKYKTDGETKYIDYLRHNDNNFKISELKFDNMDVDTLPLLQKMKFDFDLTGSDDNYIYFNPNQFTSLHTNPFLSENRFTDIEFGYRDNYSVSGIYKIPAGYKVDVLPKSMTIVMPDKSITFKRMLLQEDQTITVRYIIDHAKTTYFKEEYQDFREFSKQMYEMLNEPIALKKG
ncbi:hypothetical protein GCM10023149_34420 [Mucilaginibacter gynuensis]|uniref:DUF3857 domain-containing protein n=2 Tax=Mucilaginibacter gynuensis TaxID=1302236 RepID=A0ABP8GTD3_9SPHI